MNIEKLKSVIQEANSEMETWCKQCQQYQKSTDNHCDVCGKFTMHDDLPRPIRLADVLLAIYSKNNANKTNIVLESDGQFRQTVYEHNDPIEYQDKGVASHEYLKPTWNLKDDNLDHQSDDTKQFLIDLLT